MADDIPEEREIFYLTLLPPEGGASLGTVSRKTVIIERNDAPYGLLEIFTDGNRFVTKNTFQSRKSNSSITVHLFLIIS